MGIGNFPRQTGVDPCLAEIGSDKGKTPRSENEPCFDVDVNVPLGGMLSCITLGLLGLVHRHSKAFDPLARLEGGPNDDEGDEHEGQDYREVVVVHCCVFVDASARGSGRQWPGQQLG